MDWYLELVTVIPGPVAYTLPERRLHEVERKLHVDSDRADHVDSSKSSRNQHHSLQSTIDITHPNARDAGIPRRGRLAKDRSRGGSAIRKPSIYYRDILRPKIPTRMKAATGQYTGAEAQPRMHTYK